jgi:hypothetical protein
MDLPTLIRSVNNKLSYNVNDSEVKWIIKTVKSLDFSGYRGYKPQEITSILSKVLSDHIYNQRKRNSGTKSYLDKQERFVARPNYEFDQSNTLPDFRDKKEVIKFQNHRPIEDLTVEKTIFSDNTYKAKNGRNLLIDEIDMHEYQVFDITHGAAPVTIGQNKIIYDSDINQSQALKIDASIDVVSVFGLNNMTDIQNLFNPASKSEKNILVFDSRYRSLETDGTQLFRWNYVPTANIVRQGTVNSVGEIRNVVEMRLMQPVFPALSTLNTTTNRVSILIQEFITQSIVASGTNNYHWITRITSGQSDKFVELQTEHYNDGSFICRKPITELSTLTFSFGDPLEPIIFPPDRSNIVFLSYGATTLVQSASPHNLTAGDRIFITDFITANPDADASAISYMNNPFGIVINTIPTSDTFVIPVDTTGITPIVDLSISCYFEAFRFIFAIEFTVLTDQIINAKNVQREATDAPLIQTNS